MKNQVSGVQTVLTKKIVLGGFGAIVLLGVAGQAGACPTEPVFVRYNEYRGAVEGSGSGFEETETDMESTDQEVLSVLDLAHQLMRGEMPRSGVGHYAPDQINTTIIESFEMHLAEFPMDWYSMREFGIALLMDKQYERGFGMIKASYVGDAALMRVALDQNLLGDNSAAMTKLTTGLVRFAKSKSAGNLVGDAWFAVAMILQGKGNMDHVRSNLDRAAANGFEPALIAQMHAAISKP